MTSVEKDNKQKFSMLEFIEFLSSDSESDSNSEDDVLVQENLTDELVDKNNGRQEVKPQLSEAESELDECNDENDLQTNDDDKNNNRYNNDNNNNNNNQKNNHKTASTQKMEAKKKETLALIHQLHTHIVSLEKEKKSLLQSRIRQPDGRVYVDLLDVELKFNENRKKEKSNIENNLTRISSKIDKFKREKEEVRNCASSVEKLKTLMEDIEENVMQFKDKQRIVYEELMVEEKTLHGDLESFEKKLSSWEHVVDVPVAMKKVKGGEKKDVLVPIEVTEFEKYLLLTGGHQGGWDDIDHQTFLKLLKKYKDGDKLVRACVDNIPTQSEADIEQHVEWYEEYTVLRERKREAIQLWKNLKQNEREDALRKVDLDDEDEERKKRRKEEVMEKEREERFNRLKEHKEAERAAEEQERKAKEEAERRRQQKEMVKNMAEEKKRQELKLQVEEYRLKKMEEDEIMKNAQRAKSLQERPIISEEEKARIMERNEKMFSTKQRAKMREEEERQEKEKRLQKLKQQVTVQVDRDPDRLFKLTAGWKHRKEEQEKCKTSSTVTTGARLMPHRAVPSWRRGSNL